MFPKGSTDSFEVIVNVKVNTQIPDVGIVARQSVPVELVSVVLSIRIADIDPLLSWCNRVELSWNRLSPHLSMRVDRNVVDKGRVARTPSVNFHVRPLKQLGCWNWRSRIIIIIQTLQDWQRCLWTGVGGYVLVPYNLHHDLGDSEIVKQRSKLTWRRYVVESCSEVEPEMEIRDKAKLIPRPQPTGAVPDDGAGPVKPVEGFIVSGTRTVLLKEYTLLGLLMLPKLPPGRCLGT